MVDSYDYAGSDLAELLLRSYYPERTDKQSAVIRDFLLAHGREYSRFRFSVRVGTPIPADPSLLPAVQRGGQFSSQKRIDGLFYRGLTPVIIEAKDRVDPSCLGQVLTYRTLYASEHPDEPTPELIVIGRTSDPDTLRVLNDHGITVYLYETA